MTTPKTGAPEWVASQASPHLTVNEQARRIEAGAAFYVAVDKDLTAPPGSCADGAVYIVAASPTGAWSGHAKDLAIAVGANAANGWYFRTPEEGVKAYLQDENAEYQYSGSAWAAYAPAGSYSDENARDAIGATLVAGSGIALTVNDGADTILITNTGAGGGVGSSSSAVPATIPDLFYWWESDNILGSSGKKIRCLQNRTPWDATSPKSNNNNVGATVASSTLNSLPVLDFPGTSAGRYASLATPGSGYEFGRILSGGGTVFVVFNADAAADMAMISGDIGSVEMRFTSARKLSLEKTWTLTLGTSTTALSTGTWYQANATYNPSTGAYAFRVGRAADGSGTNVQSITGQTISVGYNWYGNVIDYDGKIAAIIAYDRVLSGGEIASVETYLNSKWGV